jgi:UDP-glucose 4-epimerase
MSHVLVLGGGQVGTFAARAIVEQGEHASVADLHPNPAFLERFGPRKGVELTRVDILDRAAVRTLIEKRGTDVVVLAAALSGDERSRDPVRAWQVQVRGADEVAHAALETGVQRLVFVSSLAVYGRPAVERIAETAAIQPRSEYGRAKAAAEECLLGFRGQGLDVRILRPCGVYGPHPPWGGSRSSRSIDTLLSYGLSGVSLPVRAPLRSADEYLYVKDLGRAIALTALFPSRTPEFVFNVSTGRATTVSELCSALKLAIPSSRLSFETVEGEETEFPPFLVSERIREAFGFEPLFDLITGLSDYVRESRLVS